MSTSKKISIVMAIAAGVMWSLMALAIRLIEVATNWQILLFRSAWMIIPLLIFIYFSTLQNPLNLVRRAGLPGVMGGIGLSLAFSMAIFAIQNTDVASALFLFSAAPFISALLGFFLLDESISLRTIFSIFLALLGIYIMVNDGFVSGDLEGKLAGLGSALGFAIFTISLRWGKSNNQLPALLNGALLSSVIALVVIVSSDETLQISTNDIFLTFVMGCILICGGMVLFIKASQNIPAAELALLTMLEIVLGPIWVLIFLGENVKSNALVGGLFVLSAIIINSISLLSAK